MADSSYTGAPDTSAPMSIKAMPKFGAQYASHMWTTYWNGTFRMGINNWEDYAYMRGVAHGRQSLESVKGYLGYVNGAESTQGYTWFDVQVLNFASRFIEKGKDELRKIDYDITVDATDILSLDEKKQFESSARTVLMLKSTIEAYGKKYEDLLPNFPEGWQPSSTEELSVYLQTNNYKLEDEIKAEIAIKQDLDWSNWKHVRNMQYDDWLVIGIAGCRVYVDQNGSRCVKYIPIERSVMSMPNDESFDNIVHAGVVEYITTEQFRMETAGVYTKAQQDKIIAEQASYNGYGRYDKNGYWYGGYYPDGKEYIAVLRFEFLAPDRKVWMKSTDKKGKIHFDEKEGNYEAGYSTDTNGVRTLDESVRDKVMKEIEAGTKELIVDDRQSCYGGTWVIGSTYCYNYGLLECDKYATLGYKFFAPNLRNGSVSSMLKQILEPMELANIAYNMQKTILGRGWIGILDVNYTKLFDLAIDGSGKGGKAWSPMEVMDLFFQKQIGIHSEVESGSGNTAFTIQQSGLTMVDYENTVIGCIQKMVTITGVDPRIESGTNISAESLKIVNEATRGALGYLYHAYQQTYASVGKSLLKYNPTFHNNYKYQRQFIVGAIQTSTAQELADFRMRVNKYASVPYDQGGLGADDEAILNNIDNLKLAELVLAYRVRKNRERAQLAKQEDMKLQAQLNNENAQQTHKLKIEEYGAEADAKIKYRAADHEAKMLEIDLQNKGLIGTKEVQMDWMHRIAKTQGADNLLKTLTMNQTDKQVEGMKVENERLIESANMYHESYLHESDKIHQHELKDKELAAKKTEDKKKVAA